MQEDVSDGREQGILSVALIRLRNDREHLEKSEYERLQRLLGDGMLFSEEFILEPPTFFNLSPFPKQEAP